MAKAKLKFDTSGERPDNVRQFGKTKKFHTQDLISLQAKTPRQKQFLRAYFSQTPLIIQDGCAGTGKTFLALYAALTEVFEPSSEYHQVVIFRSAVESRKIGFLPGDEKEKAAYYESPYMGIIDQLIGTYDHSYHNLKALGLLDFQLTSNQRGLTYDNTILVIDEVQNLDAQEIKTILGRVGVHSKVIICGDGDQDDLARYREKSGFNYLKNVIKFMPSDWHETISYKLEDIVRSGFVREFLIADNAYASELNK